MTSPNNRKDAAVIASPDSVAVDQLVDQLRRTSRNLAAVLSRMERGHLTGRNGDATAATIEHHLRVGNRLVRTLIDLPGYSDDAHGAVITRFWAIERRALGLD